MAERKDILLVAKDRSLYFFPSITELDVLSGKELLAPNFCDVHKEQLKQYQLIVFLDNGFQPEMASIVRPYTKAKIVLFFWNHFREPKHFAMLAAAQKEAALDALYHFDALEARSLNIQHNSSFYSHHMICSNVQPEYDLFFGATDNGRKEQALKLKTRFERLGLTAYYHLLLSKGNEQAGYLPYDQYVQLVAKARGILELLREGQHGVTLRTFEAAFFQKKLVTANPALPFYRLYAPENVFLLNEQPLEELPAFLEQPTRPIDEALLRFFDAPNWAARFLIEEQGVYEEFEYYPELMQQSIAL